MKLRQLKRQHFKRLRRRIWHRRVTELRAQWKRGMDNVGTTLADAMLESMRAQREFFSKAFASVATRMVRHAIRPGRGRPSPLRTCTTAADPSDRILGKRPTMVLMDELVDLADLLGPQQSQLLVALPKTQHERMRQQIAQVQREDPRRFTFHPKLPRR
jgi:hypothetical protein